MQEPNPTISENREGEHKSFPRGKEELQSYPEVQTWLKTVSPSSRKLYVMALREFCIFSNKTPTQLILIRDKEIRNPEPNSRTGIRDLVLDFREYLEKEGKAPKSINAMDGAVRGFFTAVLGKVGMVNVKNYRNREVSTKKDLVPTLEELKRMLDTVDIEEKIRILFIAQTGMRVSDAVALKVGDIQRELDLKRVPLAISYVPKKDRETIGERITFLASDGVELLKQYLDWRRKNSEEITRDSPLFVGRTKRRQISAVTAHRFNATVKNAAKKAGLNGDEKYGRVRTHCLRKFFITQMTNHGVEDKIVNFLTCHKISEVDRVYWSRRVDQLREIYAQRQRYLNPINGKKRYDPKKLKDIKAGLEELEKRISEFVKKDEIKRMISECIRDEMAKVKDSFESRIATSEEEIISLSNQGYEAQPLGGDRWLMRRKVAKSDV